MLRVVVIAMKRLERCRKEEEVLKVGCVNPGESQMIQLRND
jgi:hypothetical protein